MTQETAAPSGSPSSTASSSASPPPASAPHPVHVMAKTVGAICNLDCAYCYYLEKEKLYPGTKRFRMSDETLEAYVIQYMRQPGPVVDFAWHGGEPTLMGLEFFHRAVELQRLHRPAGKTVRNLIQTNGTRLDDDWCAFFRRHGFLVGLSIDGPRELHDRYRVDKGGKPTFDLVMRGLEHLERHGVDYNLLCCVHAGNVDHPLEVYDFFSGLGTGYWQFIPIVERRPGTARDVTPQSVDPAAYGDFLVAIFDRWVRNDVGRVSIQLFDIAMRVHAGLPAGLCIFDETCGKALVVEHNGDLYSCDHFVEPSHLLGNIHERPMPELVQLEAQRRFGQAKRDTLPAYCRRCEVRDLCNGGCPKNRFTLTPDGEEGLNYLCPGYKRIFTHLRPYMRWMAASYHAGRSPAGIMDLLRDRPAAFAPAELGRNDACYCGSGRKFKRCCGGA